MKIYKNLLIHFYSVGFALLLSACGGKSLGVPVVEDVRNRPASGPTSGPAGATVKGEAIESVVTFNKSAILGREFLYGSDLQYSAIKDEKLALTLQSMAVGHVPARFRIVGDRLQLVADQSSLFESDVNHPERLINEFPITEQTDTRITVRLSRASRILGTVVGPDEVRVSWVRSVTYVPQGDYLMMETSLENSKGSIAEFMESIFPRETLVPAGYQPIVADPARNDQAERYQFLTADTPVFADLGTGRVQTKFANRFGLVDGKTIDWYVTANAPEKYMGALRAGVEGWNRYFRKMLGRDVLQFKGVLPADVKIGDPRYNVINWDNVAQAGAAYESQATDSLTGLQSHSLIYLPLAWVNIGRDYWKAGGLSDQNAQTAERVRAVLDRATVLGQKLSVGCIDDAVAHVSLKARQNPEEFAVELLKNVLFHEVGHALGLGHNFKGSLSYDYANLGSFSTSIMDYNQYQLERPAFASLDSSDGPLLEYDRQIISVLYNQGRDVKPEDAKLASCSDEDADDVSAGVDPLCIRYDSGRNPVEAMQRTVTLFTDRDAKLGPTRSLPLALGDAVLEFAPPATMDSPEKLEAAVKAQATTLQGLANYYLNTSAQSLSYMVRANVKSLYVFKEGVIPEGYDVSQMPQMALKGFQFVAGLGELPAASKDAAAAYIAASDAWIASTAIAQQTTQVAARDALIKKVRKPLEEAAANLRTEGKEDLLTKLRTKVLSTLVRVPTAPFFVELRNGQLTDYEAQALLVLKGALTARYGAEAKTAAFSERTALVTALKTFADTREGKVVVDEIKAALMIELDAARDGRTREQIRALLKSFEPAASQPAPKA